MEEELLQELEREEQLSQLLSREVTLEGLEKFLSVVRPAAEEEVLTILPTLHRELLRIIRGIQLPSGPLSEADTKPAELLELEQTTASLVPEVVDIALKFLLEEPELKDKCKLASDKIAKLLNDSVVPCLSHFGSVGRITVLRLCTLAARSIVNSLFEGFTSGSKSFHHMDYDESYLSARYGAISAIQEMVNKIHLQPCTSEGQEEAPLQEREDSPQVLEKEEASSGVPGDEELELAMVQTHVTEASSSVNLQTNSEGQEEAPLQEREESPQVLEKEEAFPEVPGDKELAMVQPLLTEASSSVNLQTNAEGQEQAPLQEREESPQVLEKEEASPGVPGDEELAMVQSHVTEASSSVSLQTNVSVSVIDEIKVLQQEEDTQKSLGQQRDVKKKKGVRAFFRGVLKTMTRCFRPSIKD